MLGQPRMNSMSFDLTRISGTSAGGGAEGWKMSRNVSGFFGGGDDKYLVISRNVSCAVLRVSENLGPASRGTVVCGDMY